MYSYPGRETLGASPLYYCSGNPLILSRKFKFVSNCFQQSSANHRQFLNSPWCTDSKSMDRWLTPETSDMPYQVSPSLRYGRYSTIVAHLIGNVTWASSTFERTRWYTEFSASARLACSNSIPPCSSCSNALPCADEGSRADIYSSFLVFLWLSQGRFGCCRLSQSDGSVSYA